MTPRRSIVRTATELARRRDLRPAAPGGRRSGLLSPGRGPRVRHQGSTGPRPAGTVGTPMRPRTVGELAAQHGVPLEDLVRAPCSACSRPTRPSSPRSAGTCTTRHPVTTAEDLGPRRLLSYDGWSIDDDKPQVGLDAVAALPPGESLEFNPPVSALELAALLGVSDPPDARTVGIHMDSWRVDLGTHVATLDGPARGEIVLAAAGAGRTRGGGRPRALPARERLAQQAGIRRGGEAAVGEPVDAAAQATAGRRSGTGPRRRRGSSASPGSPRPTACSSVSISRTAIGTSSPSAARSSASAAGCDGQPSQYRSATST